MERACVVRDVYRRVGGWCVQCNEFQYTLPLATLTYRYQRSRGSRGMDKCNHSDEQHAFTHTMYIKNYMKKV